MKKMLPIFLTLIFIISIAAMIYAEDIGGGTFVLRGHKNLEDGTIKLGALTVEVDQITNKAKIKVVQFDSKGNSAIRWLTVSDLSKKPAGVTKYRLSDNKILTKENFFSVILGLDC